MDLSESYITLACLLNSSDIVKYLLRRSCVIANVADENSQTPLMYAASGGSIEVLSLLLEKGVNIDVADINGTTALMCAVSKGHTEIVSLLEKGVNIDVADINGTTALMCAVSKGHTEIVSLLLEKSATKVNATSKHGITALMYAVSQCNAEIAQNLIEKGAKIDIKDNNDKTVFDYVVPKGNIEIMKLLLNAMLLKRDGKTPGESPSQPSEGELAKKLTKSR